MLNKRIDEMKVINIPNQTSLHLHLKVSRQGNSLENALGIVWLVLTIKGINLLLTSTCIKNLASLHKSNKRTLTVKLDKI